MTDAPELKPCPFCGGLVEFGYFAMTANISCPRCRYEMDAAYGNSASTAKLVTRWNTRADIASAMVAAAYEAACELVAHDYVCDAIRALTPDDARAAFDRMIAEVEYTGDTCIKSLEAENARLREALEPFSKEATYWREHNYTDSEMPVAVFSGYDGVMTCGDLYRAREALTVREGN